MRKKPLCIAAIALAGWACFAAPPGLAFKSIAERWKEAAKGGMEAPLVLKIPGMDEVAYGLVEYRPGGKLDLYYPAGYDFKKPLPVVVFAMGYSTDFTMNWFGAKPKDIRSRSRITRRGPTASTPTWTAMSPAR